MEERVDTWRKSARSGTNGNCVEVADAAPVILVRDTTSRDSGTLAFSAKAWQMFVNGLK